MTASRFGVAITYSPVKAWTLRAGLAFDDSTVPAKFQRANLPNNDRVLLGLGIRYGISESVRADVGYLHSFEDEVSTDIEKPGAGRLFGELRNSADPLATQLTMRH